MWRVRSERMNMLHDRYLLWPVTLILEHATLLTELVTHWQSDGVCIRDSSSQQWQLTLPEDAGQTSSCSLFF